MSTVFILGAGFSIPSGFPSGQALNEKFFRNVERNILRYSSGEWSWDEYSSVESNNGKLNFDHLNISYLLSDLVSRFQNEFFMPFDYEEFYDWIHRDYSKDFIVRSCNNVNQRLSNENVHPSYLFNNPGLNEYSKIQEAYVYLIADLLKRLYKRDANLNIYNSFLKKVSEDNNTKIFTLNHDLLLEYILEKNNISYSDGFTIESDIVNEDSENLPVFNDYFSNNLHIHKLHGSIDYYQFSELRQASEGNLYHPTGNYWFFKTLLHNDIHSACQIDPVNKKIVQSVNPDIKPQFITGKSKSTLIKKHKVYSKLYQRLTDSLEKCNRVIIIGYSYRDFHINKLLLETIESNSCEIINVNPYVKFPFRRRYSYENIMNLKYLQDL